MESFSLQINNRTTRSASESSDYYEPYIESDIDYNFVQALSELSIGESTLPRPSLYNLLPEILESIFICLPVPRRVAGVCRLFRAIVVTSKSFKRSWIRYWLHPELPKSFMPSYSQLCQAVDTKTPFNILMEIIDLQVLGKRRLQSSYDGSVTRLFDAAFAHPTSGKLIPYLISRGVKIDRYITAHTLKDCELTDNGSFPEGKLEKDYLSLVKDAGYKSLNLRQELANRPSFFSDTELAFAIVLHERLDVATALAYHPQHTLDILEESVDKQYTKGIGWAFERGLGEIQKRNPLYLRLCIEKADVEAARLAIENGAEINISPSSHKGEPAKFGSTSLLEFTIQCYLAYTEEENKSARWKLIELFLKSGADANADNGRPLCLCVTNNHWELTRLLLAHKADPRRNDMLAVKIATDFGYKDMAKQLYEICKSGGSLSMSTNVGRHRRQSSTNSSPTNNDDGENEKKNGVKNLLRRRWTLAVPKVTLVGKRRMSDVDKSRRPNELGRPV
ncbi:3576_t:CDS:1 [Paraglomus brasilianum]|uniref:3576_t:CDS:1 n=1 Tax=Paraglomus brasilianum TaxID=144538 RepID=A0A9N9A4M2_9GLOM|nr:3576_t:CDS:1 [Paraglomus brasilianum]